MKNIIPIILLILITIVGCAQIDSLPDESNSLQSLPPDSFPDGKHIEYYDDGQIKLSGEILDHKKVGFFFTYYSDGTMESQALFIDDISFGLAKYFHPNGALESYVCFSHIEDHLVKEGFFNRWFYKSTYDSEGKLLSEHGEYLTPIIIYNDGYVLGVDTMWTADIFLAQPPHMNNEVRVIIYNEDKSILYNTKLIFDEGYCNYPVIQSFSKKGIYEFNLITNFINLPMHRDTLRPNYNDSLIGDTIKFDNVVN